MKYRLNIFCCGIPSLLLAVSLLSGSAFSEDNPPERVADMYPDLARGILTEALVQPLPPDVVVRVRDTDISLDMLAQKFNGLPEETKKNDANLLFYLLEGMVERPIILTVVLNDQTLPEGNEAVQDLFKKYINKVIADVKITEAEALAFYVSHSDMFGDTPFEDIKDEIMEKELQRKQREVWNEHIRRLGLQFPIIVNASWLAEQAPKVKDNPLDKARASEQPVFAAFISEHCPASEQLKPVLDILTENNTQELPILILYLEKNDMLGRRYTIVATPTLLFFDDTGKEVERYTGFISGEKLLEKLKKIYTPETYDVTMNK